MARGKSNINITKEDIAAIEATSVSEEIAEAESIILKEDIKKKDNEIIESIGEPEPKRKVIIAKQPIPFRRSPNLSASYISGMMPAGRAFEIVKEYSSKIYGDFYQLDNGMYITKGGLYSIS